MQLSFQHQYPAPPADVVKLMADEAFIADVAEHAGAVSHEATVAPGRTTLQMEMPTPSDVAGVIGKTVKLSISMAFGTAEADGTVPGNVEVEVPGMPVQAHAKARIVPVGEASVGHYDGEVKVKIPLVGKKVEAKIEPFVVQAFRGIERRAQVWLTR